VVRRADDCEWLVAEHAGTLDGIRHLPVDGEDFYIDLLFYHFKLRCYIVIEIKTTPFKPEYVGKMNFYLSAVDDQLGHPQDKLSIGLILCETRSRVIAEYALRNVASRLNC
jgi:hypothetical protein